MFAAAVGKVQVLAFANFGMALRSSANSAKGDSDAILDYSKQDLSISSEAREKVTASCWSGHHTVCASLELHSVRSGYLIRGFDNESHGMPSRHGHSVFCQNVHKRRKR